MRKTVLISSFFVILAIGLNSCHKCSVCTITTTEIVNDKDSTLVLSTEVCNGKNGAGDNYKSAIQDIEANGYTCVPK
jgi:hypothetical protein